MTGVSCSSEFSRLGVHTIALGPFQTNAYVLHQEAGRCFVVDPGMDPEPLLDLLDEQELVVAGILLTHGHLDHIGGCRALVDRFDCPIYLHSADRFLYEGLSDFGRLYGFQLEPAPESTLGLDELLKLPCLDAELEILPTPGHSPGSVCFLARLAGEADLLFCGDTLFVDSYGRTDLPGGDGRVLRHSLMDRLFKLDPDTRFFPGHGPEGRIGSEVETNPIRWMEDA